MDPRFESRKQQLLADCQVPPATFRGAIRRLEAFAQPFIATMPSPESREYSRIYLAGLLSDLPRKNAEAIAYRNDLDRQRIQEFLGYSDWDRDPMREELARQVGREIGRPDGVIVFDPSAFPKKGSASVGVQRQWCGRLGKVENCQVGVYLGYVSEVEHALVDFRLYLPKEWAKDKARRQTCGVPEDLRYQTRHALALEMLARRGAALPHGWVSGDDEMGRPAWFRRELNEREDPRPGGRAAGLRGEGPPSQGAVPAGPRLVRGAARRGVGPADGPRRGEGAVGCRDREAAGGVEGGTAGRGLRGVAGGGEVRGRCQTAI
jgi:hypothetical protein